MVNSALMSACASADPSGEQWRREQQQQAEMGLSKADEACGRELGRWITPFRRRVGRWLTDVTPLWPLLSSRQCRCMPCILCNPDHKYNCAFLLGCADVTCKS